MSKDSIHWMKAWEREHDDRISALHKWSDRAEEFKERIGDLNVENLQLKARIKELEEELQACRGRYA